MVLFFKQRIEIVTTGIFRAIVFDFKILIHPVFSILERTYTCTYVIYISGYFNKNIFVSDHSLLVIRSIAFFPTQEWNRSVKSWRSSIRPGGINSREKMLSDGTTPIFFPYRGNLHYLLSNGLIGPF